MQKSHQQLLNKKFELIAIIKQIDKPEKCRNVGPQSMEKAIKAPNEI